METKNGRAWRKRSKRGVSPIIATILLVAITVVLAAVLYVLISGLTRGPGNTPIGSAFGMASPTQETGAAGTTQCTTVGNVCYTIQIASASSGLNWNDVNFVVHTPAGNPATLGTGAAVYVVSATGTLVSTCVLGSTCTGTSAVNTSQILVLNSGAATTISGDILVANGVGSYSSSVSINLP